MADEEKRPRRRHRQPKAQEEPALSHVEILNHNVTTMGIAIMKLLQAIYAEQRAASFFAVSQETGDGEASAEIFRHATNLQQQGTELVRGAWNDIRGPVGEEEQEQDGDPEVQGG